MNDEKTTEIEIPAPLTQGTVVRVNFTERRKVARPLGTPVFPEVERQRQLARQIPFESIEWETPWWVRVGALLAILALSLFVV